MTDARPAPLVPPEVDLRDFKFMPLEIQRLQNSDTWGSQGRLQPKAKPNPWVLFACMNLWLSAWHEVPAGSIPSDDPSIIRRASVDYPVWKRIRERVLASWILCSDGRYYHPVVCEKALEAWERKKKQRQRTKAATEAAAEARREDRRAAIKAASGIRDDDRNGPKNSSVTASKGQGQGQKKESPPLTGGCKEHSPLTGDGEGKSVTDVSRETEMQVYRRGKEVLGESASPLIKKLVNALTGDYAAALTAIEAAATKQDPREYIGGVIAKAKPQEQKRGDCWVI